MSRPTITKFVKPKHINDYPTGPCFQAGHLVTENAGWRTEKPIIDSDKCIGCYQCYLYCPEGVIFKTGKKVNIDYAFCKGCGICVRVCHKEAIKLVKEGGNNVK